MRNRTTNLHAGCGRKAGDAPVETGTCHAALNRLKW
jgi:hypothetical protein